MAGSRKHCVEAGQSGGTHVWLLRCMKSCPSRDSCPANAVQRRHGCICWCRTLTEAPRQCLQSKMQNTWQQQREDGMMGCAAPQILGRTHWTAADAVACRADLSARSHTHNPRCPSPHFPTPALPIPQTHRASYKAALSAPSTTSANEWRGTVCLQSVGETMLWS